MTLSPYTLGDRVPAGCANTHSHRRRGVRRVGRPPSRQHLGAFWYFADKDQLQGAVWQEVGEQFIPICAGGRPVDPDRPQSGGLHDA